jgi:hypothetical protein
LQKEFEEYLDKPSREGIRFSDFLIFSVHKIAFPIIKNLRSRRLHMLSRLVSPLWLTFLLLLHPHLSMSCLPAVEPAVLLMLLVAS